MRIGISAKLWWLVDRRLQMKDIQRKKISSVILPFFVDTSKVKGFGVCQQWRLSDIQLDQADFTSNCYLNIQASLNLWIIEISIHREESENRDKQQLEHRRRAAESLRSVIHISYKRIPPWFINQLITISIDFVLPSISCKQANTICPPWLANLWIHPGRIGIWREHVLVSRAIKIDRKDWLSSCTLLFEPRDFWSLATNNGWIACLQLFCQMWVAQF